MQLTRTVYKYIIFILYAQSKREGKVYVYRDHIHVTGRWWNGASNICSYTLICYTFIHKSIYVGISVSTVIGRSE